MTLISCEGSTSTLQSAGPSAKVIADLWWMMFIGAALIFVLMMMLLALAYRTRPQEQATAGHGRRAIRIWILSFGLGFPVAVLLTLLIYALVIGERLLPRDDPDTVNVGALAQRWTWTFSYRDAPGLRTKDTLHIPAGRPIDVEISSADVIHSFWVPRLAGKLDAIPGRVNVLRIEADEPGSYQGLSAEFAGTGYDDFGFTVTAHDPAGWAAFIGGDAR